MKLDLSPVTGAYQRLSSRERRLLEGAVGAMLAIGFYSFVWQPLQDSQVELGRRIQVKQHELSEMQQMREDYLDLMNQFELRQKIIEKADPKFALFPHIESTVSQVLGGRDKIASMNPQSKDLGGAYREESVELKLSGVSLQQLEELMYHIEKGAEPLRLTRLQVKKRARDPQTFDVTATVSMLKALDTGKAPHAGEKIGEAAEEKSSPEAGGPPAAPPPAEQAPSQAPAPPPAQAPAAAPPQAAVPPAAAGPGGAAAAPAQPAVDQPTGAGAQPLGGDHAAKAAAVPPRVAAPPAGPAGAPPRGTGQPGARPLNADQAAKLPGIILPPGAVPPVGAPGSRPAAPATN